MYDLLINIEGKTYYPARAIPCATAGYIKPQAVAKLLSESDVHFSATSYRYVTRSGTLERLDSAMWLSIKATKEEELPGGVLVPEDELKHVWFVCFCDPDSMIDRKEEGPIPEAFRLPLREMLMTSEQYTILMEGMPKRGSAKKASGPRAIRIEKLTTAFAIFLERARSQGVTVDPTSLPGTREQLLTCLKSIDPSIDMKPSTLMKDAKKDLRWKFLPGRGRAQTSTAFYASVSGQIRKRN
jgi:hypothetical protein